MKRGPEMYSKLCDAFTKYAFAKTAARIAGVSESTYYELLNLSMQNPEAFMFEWRSFGARPLHEHIVLAKQIAVDRVSGSAIDDAIETQEQVTFKGQERFVFDDEVIKLGLFNPETGEYNPDFIQLEFGKRHPYVENPDGTLKRLYVKRSGTTAAKQLVLRAHQPELYGDKREITGSLTLSRGVQVAHRQAPAIAPPVMHVIEQIANEPETPIEETPAPTSASTDQIPITNNADPHDDPEEFVGSRSVEAEPMARVSAANPANKLRAELERQYEANRARVAEKSRSAPDNVGRGKIPPGGFKVI